MYFAMAIKKRKFLKRAFHLKLKKGAVYSIAQISFFALAGLVLISFSRQGLALVRLNDFLTSLFGWATIFLTFIFLSFAFLVSKMKFVLGAPNVLVGSLLFFVSIATLGRAGIIGREAWEGISSLVTSFGAAIILLGTTVVGLVILFNTSLDAFFKLVLSILNQIKKFTIGDK